MALIQHKTLRQETLEAIEKMILTGELEQGARMVEQDLADRLGVSRGPIREALRQLEQEGLVEYIANRGCFVRQVGPRDILEVDLMKTYLELMALDLQQGALPDAVLDQMEELVDRMSGKGMESTLSDILEEDEAFHRLIIQSVRMERLYWTWSGMSQSSVEMLKRFEEDKAFAITWHRDLHVTLLAALRTKKMPVIRPAMIRHMAEVVQFLTDGKDLEFDLQTLLQ